LQWGPTLGQLQTIARREGKVPKALADEPEIFEDMRPYWQAYAVLIQSRLETGRIPVSETMMYLSHCQLRVDLMLRVVRELDDIYVEHHKEKTKLKTKPRPRHGHRRT